MKEIEGLIRTTPEDAEKVAVALIDGPVMFSWTNGGTQYDFYMIPSRCFRTWFMAPEKIHRWVGYGNVVVAIERKGCFHFNLMSGTQEFAGDYVGEKLSLERTDKECGELAELFNLISTFFGRKGRNIVL